MTYRHGFQHNNPQMRVSQREHVDIPVVTFRETAEWMNWLDRMLP